MNSREAIVRDSLERLSPILMTAGLALIPLAFGGGEPGNEMQTPMAIVILGRLLSATTLNMIVLPALCWRLGNAVNASEQEREVLELRDVPAPYGLAPRTS